MFSVELHIKQPKLSRFELQTRTAVVAGWLDLDRFSEHLHQWLQPSKQPNVAPFGRLDGWSTGGWDLLQT